MSSLKNLVKPIGFVFCALLIAILLWQFSQCRTTSLQYLDQEGVAHTLNLPVKDRKMLTALMQKLFAEDSFAYTILGSKPVSWETYQNPLPLSDWASFYNSFSKYNRTMRSGWKTWEKYRHLFPQVHFRAENPKCYPGSTSILIINEDRFNDVVNKHKSDFQEALGREIVDGFQLIKEAKDNSLMNDVLQGHQALIGIVLGYGRDNSWKFFEGCKNRKAIGWVWGNGDDYFDKKATASNIKFTDYYLLHYSCPSFSGDPDSEESLALKAEYILTKQKVLDYYNGKDFLEASLSLLAGYNPNKRSGC